MQADAWSNGRSWGGNGRLAGLRRFAIAITVLNALGHTLLGFEQAWITPFVAVLAAYVTETLLEVVASRGGNRPPRFVGGWRQLVDFLLPAHITGLAVGMLLYTNGRLGPVVFAAVTAIASKTLVRIRIADVSRHVLNPSNFGITATLLLFPWVGIAPPYHFTENVGSIGDWLLPAAILVTGTLMNVRFTKRLPLLLAWLAGFAIQAGVRGALSDQPLASALVPALAPMTGLAFVLYTFYMITDPATTPDRVVSQIAFGASVAAVYGALVALHVVFGLFFALTLVSCGRLVGLAAIAPLASRVSGSEPQSRVILDRA
jgi:enediyne biosynthesis protein E5